MSTPRFQVDDPLPMGHTTLLDASAGTGKTYALAALTVRFVAEERIPIANILLVTFTRAATAELRERIRTRLVEAVEHLDSGAEVDPREDPLLAALGRGSADDRGERRTLLEQAVREYDTATIVTIHGFCSQIRASLGVLADQNPDAIPTTSEAELIRQVASDLLFTAASTGGVDADDGDDPPAPLPSLETVCSAVAKARMLGDCTVQAESGHPKDLRLVELVQATRDEVDSRLRLTGGVSFDSLIATARGAVRSDDDLVASLRDQYRVALVDEFQDTDPVQWEIFRKLFAEDDRPDPSTLVLVGDPKQAIYAFRGGDVYTYLAARHLADQRVLGVNQRSDAPVVDAMNALAAGQAFGEEEIAFETVQPSPRHAGRQLRVHGAPAPGLDLRVVLDAASCGLGVEKLSADTARERIAIDLADVAVELLDHGVVHGGSRPTPELQPGDLAVLLPARSQAQRYADALRERGIPAILRLGDNVADSAAAEQWRTLLHALDRPASTSRAGAVALGWWFGWAPERVADALAHQTAPTADTRDDDHPTSEPAASRELLELQHRLVQWAELLRSSGVAALFGEIRRRTDLVPRLLATRDGERDLTDVEHLAELLHANSLGPSAGGVTAAAALGVLNELGGTAEDEVASDAVQRRIESEADAVQIMTVHGSKGLEFPVVLLPELYAGGVAVEARGDYAYFDLHQERRVLDVSTKRPAADGRSEVTRPKAAPTASAETKRQNCGNQHRLTYVALTRAQHQSVVWWSPTGKGPTSVG